MEKLHKKGSEVLPGLHELGQGELSLGKEQRKTFCSQTYYFTRFSLQFHLNYWITFYQFPFFQNKFWFPFFQNKGFDQMVSVY